MRLINADSIKFRPYYDDYVDYDGYINDLKTWQLDDILSDRVDNAPTVKAIPIEWIRSQKVDYQNKYLPFDYCRGMQDGFNDCIDYLLSEWEEENQSLE